MMDDIVTSYIDETLDSLGGFTLFNATETHHAIFHIKEVCGGVGESCAVG